MDGNKSAVRYGEIADDGRDWSRALWFDVVKAKKLQMNLGQMLAYVHRNKLDLDEVLVGAHFEDDDVFLRWVPQSVLRMWLGEVA